LFVADVACVERSGRAKESQLNERARVSGSARVPAMLVLTLKNSKRGWGEEREKKAAHKSTMTHT
jgi:hypothetical protein